MRRSLAALLLSLGLVTGASAFAANERRHKPAEFQEISEEDRAAARERARNRVSAWREGADMPPEYKFPWMQLGFTALMFAIALPFAWGAYNRHAREIREREAALAPPARKTRAKAAPVEE
jgi:hypothetical protein